MVSQIHTTTFLFFTTFLLISRSILAVHLSQRQKNTTTNDLDFIRTSCNATLYPEVCFTSLAGYAYAVQESPARLAKLAIGVSLSQAKSTAAQRSEERFRFEMSNVQTWMSAALTDEDTCTEGFEEMEEEEGIKTTVRYRVEEVKRLTSNALALVNTYANIGSP